jgi:hypothetical protein
LPGWTWDGPGQGLLHRTDYTESGGDWLFPAHSGQNALDMTGPGWTGINVLYQNIPTVIGQPYVVSFWLGNQDDDLSPYPNPSSVELMIGGQIYGPFTHSHSGNESVEWVQRSQGFIADAVTTRILFRNVTPLTDSYLGLDDVSVDDAQPAAIPEPSTLLPLAAAAFALFRCRSKINAGIPPRP